MNNTVVTQLYKSINIFNRFGMMIRLSGYLYFYFSFPECLWISITTMLFLPVLKVMLLLQNLFALLLCVVFVYRNRSFVCT